MSNSSKKLQVIMLNSTIINEKDYDEKSLPPNIINNKSTTIDYLFTLNIVHRKAKQVWVNESYK